MEQAELSVDAGSLGQLDPEQLDPEHQFDFETEGFDFNLDGVYDETTQAVVQDNTADAVQDLSAVAVTTDNDEIGYEDDEEEIQIGSAQPEETETLEVVVKDDDAEAVTVIVTETRTEVEAEEVPVDYQDEIGYEDDDFAAADISIDLKPEQAVEPAAEHPIRQQTRIPESGQEAYDSTETRAQIEVTESGAAAIAEEELDLAAHGEDEAMDEHPDDAEKENREVFANHDDIAQAQYQDESVPEDYVADQDDDEDSSQGVSDLDRAIEDLTNSLRSIPEVEVLYNDGSYSLFGTSDDDPESFFLSGTKHLDKSLAGLLSSLREVLSDEISPTDELVIGFESLGLEFGERSNEKFLERSLRELLDCHAALAAKNFEDFSAAPTLRLMVQQDCEERFLQLLQEAELDDESPGQKDYDESEQQDEWPSANSLDDEQSEQAVQAQQPEEDPNAGHEDSGKHEDVDAGAHIPGPIPTASGNLADQTDASMEQNFSFQDSLDDTEYHESEAPDGGEESIDDQMGEHTEQHIDEHVEEHVVEEHVVEEHVVEEHVVEEHVVEEHVVEEHVAEDHVVEEHAEEQIEPHMEAFAGHPTEQNNHQFTTEDMDDIIAHEETRPENIPHEAPTDNQGGQQHDLGETGDVFEVEETSLEEFDGFTTAGNEGAEQATGSYDDDLMLGYDHDAGLSMIEEQEAEYDVIVTLSAEDNVKEVDDGAVKNDQTVHNSRQQDEAVDNGPQYNSAIGDSGSIHTSTTMNGDEIDYDENDPAADSFNPESNAQVSAASLGVENDEIDWGNDGYEYHEDRGDVDTSIASEEPKEVALTPSSLAAKRSRTDEAEGLAEESDNKRRRT
ncbi:hypothetical protein QBC42DRAFT_18950 [Cladorrhinum samala]|uniref:Uncharacterized protein n=1 Tax=Cladorrhinum samala TaxID=585594 RepID=A0AAV9HDL6_9PEZI|nr:hypothetical protein QBC42DRAFT_18950 [Cladorrhinum samala]